METDRGRPNSNNQERTNKYFDATSYRVQGSGFRVLSGFHRGDQGKMEKNLDTIIVGYMLRVYWV